MIMMSMNVMMMMVDDSTMMIMMMVKMTAQWWHQPGQRWQVLTRSRCAENPSFPFKGSYKMQWKLSWRITLYHFVFQVCHFYTTSKKADAEMEIVSFISNESTPDVDTGSQCHTSSSVVVIIVIAISSLSRCPQGMYLLPSIISGHQPFQELGWWIQMAIAWPNGGSESGHLIIIAITNFINLLIRDVINDHAIIVPFPDHQHHHHLLYLELG